MEHPVRFVMQVRKRRLWSASGVLFAALLVVGCRMGDGGSNSATAQAQSEEQTRRIPVRAAQVQTGAISSVLTTTTVIEAQRVVDVVARAAGIVRAVHADEGDDVVESQVLVQLEDEELRADFAEATLRVEQLGRELSRLRKLHKETFASDEELEMRTNELALAKIVRDRAGLRLSYTQIVAPFGGRVLARAVEPGQHLSPGATVMRLADLTPLKAELAVPERQVNQIQAGAEVKLVMDADGREVVGEVVRKSPAVDADTGTVRVTIHLRSDPPLPRPGAFARAELVLETRPAALLVPRNAVLTEGQSAYVFVIENGAAVQTEVKTGFEDADRIELIHGLEAGSLVVTTGARALENGAKIDVLPDPHDAG